MKTKLLLKCAIVLSLACRIPAAEQSEPSNVRKPASDAELMAWLQNMVWYHRFDTAEIIAATGLSQPDAASALQRFNITTENMPRRPDGAPLLVLEVPHILLGWLWQHDGMSRCAASGVMHLSLPDLRRKKNATLPQGCRIDW
jgi:hypothetical protein